MLDLTTVAEGADPITAIITRDWAALGGWSLFIGLGLFFIIGAFREWWVPGARYRRLEDASKTQSETMSTLSKALDQQVRANEIVKHFFEETVPGRRGSNPHDSTV